MSDKNRIPTVEVGSGQKFLNDKGIAAIKDGIKSSGASAERLEKPDWLRIRVAAARFHLGNGAQLYGLHGGADLSMKGKEESAGIMVNYLYDLPHIEENHEAYFDQGEISVSKAVSRLLG